MPTEKELLDEICRKLKKDLLATQELEHQRIEHTDELLQSQLRQELLLRRQVRNQEEILERYAHLAEQVTGLIIQIQNMLDIQKAVLAILGWQEGATELMQRVERLLYILIGRRGNGGDEVANLEKKESLRRQLMTHQHNLNILSEQAARYGTDVPLDLTNKIRDTTDIVELLEEKLGDD